MLAGIGKVADVEAAWKLADKTNVTVDDDGNVTGMDAAVDAAVQKYPYLSAKPADGLDPALTDKFPALLPSGRQTNARPRAGDSLNRTALEAKFPALRRRA